LSFKENLLKIISRSFTSPKFSFSSYMGDFWTCYLYVVAIHMWRAKIAPDIDTNYNCCTLDVVEFSFHSFYSWKSYKKSLFNIPNLHFEKGSKNSVFKSAPSSTYNTKQNFIAKIISFH